MIRYNKCEENGPALTTPVADISPPSATPSDGCSRFLRNVVHVRAWIGKDDIGAFPSGTSVTHVGHKHGWSVVDGVVRASLLLAGSVAHHVGGLDGDVRAVHVHFPIAHPIEPRPRKEGIPRGGVLGQGEDPVLGERTAANVRVDGGPGGAPVVGEGDLARAAGVGGAADDADVVGLAGLPGDYRPALGAVEELVIALAGVVGARGEEGRGHAVVDVGGVAVELGPEGRWMGHFHVGGGEGREGGQKGERLHHHLVSFILMKEELMRLLTLTFCDDGWSGQSLSCCELLKTERRDQIYIQEQCKWE